MRTAHQEHQAHLTRQAWRQGWLAVNNVVQPLVVNRCENAWQRLRGQLLAPTASAGQLWRLEPCRGVHTFFMGAAIDVAFCAHDGRILMLVAPLPPWRFAVCGNARSAWELPAGSAAALGLEPGDRLVLVASDVRPT